MNTSLTEIYGRVILGVFVVAVLMAIARAAFAAPVAVTPIDAIEQAVARRLGADVRGGRHRARDQRQGAAGPRGAARAWRARRPARAVRADGAAASASASRSRPSGRAARTPRAARAIARAEAHQRAPTSTSWTTSGRRCRCSAMPAADEIVGLKARRNIAAGEALTAAVLDVPPLVKSGDVVTVTATVGAVQVTGAGHRRRAAGSAETSSA